MFFQKFCMIYTRTYKCRLGKVPLYSCRHTSPRVGFYTTKTSKAMQLLPLELKYTAEHPSIPLLLFTELPICRAGLKDDAVTAIVHTIAVQW